MSAILVVDDQPVVRQGLIKMIKEMQVDFGIFYEAGDGEEALYVAREHKPDIILVDIAMPKLDGMQTIEKLKEEAINSHIVIISAYGDFDITKRAISNKVDEYILKPVSDKELFEVLLSIKEKIEKDSDYAQELKDKERQYYQMLLHKYLGGDDIFINLDKVLNNIGFTYLKNPSYKIIIVHYDGEDERHEWVKQNMDSAFSRCNCPIISFNIESRKLIYILNLQADSSDLCDLIIRKRLEQTKESVHCGISGTLDGVKALRELYQQAVIAQKESSFKGVKACLFADVQEGKPLLIRMNELNRIFNLLNEGKKDELDRIINALFIEISEYKLSITDIQNNLMSIINYLYLNLLDAYPGIYDTKSVRESFQESLTAFSAKVLFKKVIDSMYSYIQEFKQKNNSSYVISYIKKYINENYGKKISLAQVSNALSMNYFYVSGLFAKATGVSFSDYVSSVRFKKAKELLSSTNEKIYIIAEQCGFYDAKYFCKVFRKQFDATPGEFRKRHRAGESRE